MANVSPVFTRSSEKQKMYTRLETFFTSFSFLSFSLSLCSSLLSVPFFFFARFRPVFFLIPRVSPFLYSVVLTGWLRGTFMEVIKR